MASHSTNEEYHPAQDEDIPYEGEQADDLAQPFDET